MATYRCPHCGASTNVYVGSTGKTVRCQGCKREFRVTRHTPRVTKPKGRAISDEDDDLPAMLPLREAPSPTRQVTKPPKLPARSGPPAAQPPSEPAPNLIPCPDCGQKVSRHAVSCPNCGRPFTGNTAYGNRTPAVKDNTVPQMLPLQSDAQGTSWATKPGESRSSPRNGGSSWSTSDQLSGRLREITCCLGEGRSGEEQQRGSHDEGHRRS